MSFDSPPPPTRRRTTRVLVVDDSLFMRTLVADLLQADPHITVVGTARSGDEALRLVPKLRPDCVVLDFAMPGLDGLETLRAIMTSCPTPVIMLTAHSQAGSAVAGRCLAAGALDCVPKPSGELSLDIDAVAQQLRTKIRRAARVSRRLRRAAIRSGAPAKRRGPALIVLGASTGGQPVLEHILTQLPPGLNWPLLVVQHAPCRMFSESLATRLDRRCALPVRVPADGERLRPDMVYVAPSESRLTIERGSDAADRFRLWPDPGRGLTPSIDTAMISAAALYGAGVTGMILPGLGQDGLAGVQAIRAVGGRIFVQGAAAAVLGLPRAVLERGWANAALTADELVRVVVAPETWDE